MSDPDSKLPPHNSEAERAVLGCALLNPELIDQLDPAWFYELRNQNLAKGMQAGVARNIPIDLCTIKEAIIPLTIEECGGMEYLMGHVDSVPSVANFGYYAEILEEQLMMRQIVRCCAENNATIMNREKPAKEILEEFEIAALAIRRRTLIGDQKSIKELVRDCITSLDEAFTNKGKPTGLMTGFVDLDKVTNGLEPGMMFVLAARPSLGKTSFAMNVAEHLSVNLTVPVAVYSLEMSAASLVNRMVCSRARVNSTDAKRGDIADRDFARIGGATAQIAKAPLHIINAIGWTIGQIRQHARKLIKDFKIKFVALDYIQLVGSGGGSRENPNERVSAVSNGVKKMAGENSVVVMALSQLNREVTKEDRRPRLSDLRDSGAVEQDADIVGLLHEDDKKHITELIIAKNRNGPCDMITLVFQKQFTRFESASKAIDVEI